MATNSLGVFIHWCCVQTCKSLASVLSPDPWSLCLVLTFRYKAPGGVGGGGGGRGTRDAGRGEGVDERANSFLLEYIPFQKGDKNLLTGLSPAEVHVYLSPLCKSSVTRKAAENKRTNTATCIFNKFNNFIYVN